MDDPLGTHPFGEHSPERPLLQILAHHALRQPRDAQSREHRGAQHHKIMADDARRVLRTRNLRVGAHELPGAPVELAGVVERRVLPELRRIGELTRTREVLRARDQILVDVPEAAHHEAVLPGRYRAHAQRHIEPFGENIDAPVAHLQLQADGGILLEELRQNRRERRLSERDGTARLDRPAGLRAGELHRLDRRVRFRQHGARMPIDLVADLGDDKTSGGAIHQTHVEFRLERHHVA